MKFTFKSLATLSLGLLVVSANAVTWNEFKVAAADSKVSATQLQGLFTQLPAQLQKNLAAKQELEKALAAKQPGIFSQLQKNLAAKQELEKALAAKQPGIFSKTLEHKKSVKPLTPEQEAAIYGNTYSGLGYAEAPVKESRFGTKSKVALGLVTAGVGVYGAYKAYENRDALKETAQNFYSGLTLENGKSVVNYCSTKLGNTYNYLKSFVVSNPVVSEQVAEQINNATQTILLEGMEQQAVTLKKEAKLGVATFITNAATIGSQESCSSQLSEGLKSCIVRVPQFDAFGAVIK
jgi:hypothetical protein